VAKLTNSEPPRHERRKLRRHNEVMRYLAASIGFFATIILILPIH